MSDQRTADQRTADATGAPDPDAVRSADAVGPSGDPDSVRSAEAAGEGSGAAGSGAGPDPAAGGAGPAPSDDTVPRSVRRLVAVVLLALAVPGVIGFELWPLTGWRLFSLSRDDSVTQWVIEAVDGEGTGRPVDLEELPLGYRHAAWPMAELPGASTARREAVCQALLGAVAEVEPATVALNVTRDRQRLVERDGDWTLTHDPEVIHTCTVAEAGE